MKKRNTKSPMRFLNILVGFIVAVGAYWFLPDESPVVQKVQKLTGQCEDNLYQGKRPVIALKVLEKESKELCYTGYAAKASFITKSNIYSAEKLTQQRVSVKLSRENSFHEELALPQLKRAELADYRTSGYDRGHLAPSADMPTKKAQHESFSLANMVPQVGEHNQRTWAKVESKVRELAKQYKEIYVVTMPMYANEQGVQPSKMKTIGGNKVFVPLYMIKAIYIPSINKATVIMSPNDKTNTVKTISLKTYQKINGIDVFPTLSDVVKEQDGGFFKW